MKTLYELLGVRPDDDAEVLKRAFRKAVKASHPDIHAGDPEASTRFRHIVKAYAILRDPEQRAAYEQLLALEREQHRSRYTTRKFVFDAIVVACLAVVMAGGYTLFVHVSRMSVETALVVVVPTRGLAESAAVASSEPAVTTSRAEPRDKTAGATAGVERGPELASATSIVASVASRGDVPGIADGAPAATLPAPTEAVAVAAVDVVHVVDAPTEQAPAATGADDLTGSLRIAPSDRKKARPFGRRLTALEGDDGAPKSSSSGVATPVENREVKPRYRPISEPRRMVVKRQVMNRAPTVTYRASASAVSLENRSTSACSGCSGHAPALFGVGF